jgi:hypothetical protein
VWATRVCCLFMQVSNHIQWSEVSSPCLLLFHHTVLQAHHTTVPTGPFNIPSKAVPFVLLVVIQVPIQSNPIQSNPIQSNPLVELCGTLKQTSEQIQSCLLMRVTALPCCVRVVDVSQRLSAGPLSGCDLGTAHQLRVHGLPVPDRW